MTCVSHFNCLNPLVLFVLFTTRRADPIDVGSIQNYCYSPTAPLPSIINIGREMYINQRVASVISYRIPSLIRMAML